MAKKITMKHDPLSGKYCLCNTCRTKAIKKIRQTMEDLNALLDAKKTPPLRNSEDEK